jgi:hypothetical protein
MTDAAVPAAPTDIHEASVDLRLALRLAAATFVLVVDTSLMNVSIAAVVRDIPPRPALLVLAADPYRYGTERCQKLGAGTPVSPTRAVGRRQNSVGMACPPCSRST